MIVFYFGDVLNCIELGLYVFFLCILYFLVNILILQGLRRKSLPTLSNNFSQVCSVKLIAKRKRSKVLKNGWHKAPWSPRIKITKRIICLLEILSITQWVVVMSGNPEDKVCGCSSLGNLANLTVIRNLLLNQKIGLKLTTFIDQEHFTFFLFFILIFSLLLSLSLVIFLFLLFLLLTLYF